MEKHSISLPDGLFAAGKKQELNISACCAAAIRAEILVCEEEKSWRNIND